MARCRVDWDDGEDLVDQASHHRGDFVLDFGPDVAQQDVTSLHDQLADRFTCRIVMVSGEAKACATCVHTYHVKS